MSGPTTAGRECCERLYVAQAARLILYGRALGLSHAEAEDVLQETFAALLRVGQPPDNPHRYYVRAFRNRALNYRRGVWRRVRRELESRRWFETTADSDAQERAAMRGLAALPQVQREVIVLKIWHGYTFQEIGDLLGTSPNTIAGRYRHGLDKVRAHLKREAYAERRSVGQPTEGLGASWSLCET